MIQAVPCCRFGDHVGLLRRNCGLASCGSLQVQGLFRETPNVTVISTTLIRMITVIATIVNIAVAIAVAIPFICLVLPLLLLLPLHVSCSLLVLAVLSTMCQASDKKNYYHYHYYYYYHDYYYYYYYYGRFRAFPDQQKLLGQLL